MGNISITRGSNGGVTIDTGSNPFSVSGPVNIQQITGGVSVHPHNTTGLTDEQRKIKILTSDTLTVNGASYSPADAAALHAKLRDEVFFLANGRGDVSTTYELFNDFEGGQIGTIQASAGTGAAIGMAAETNRPGVLNMITGSTATGRSSVQTTVAAYKLGGGVWTIEGDVAVGNNLSSGTDRFQLIFGFASSASTADQTDGAYFLYDEGGVSTGSTASPNWQMVVANNSTRSFVTSTVPAVSLQWVRLKVVVNLTNVQFFINNQLLATIETTYVNRGVMFLNLILKSLGTTSRDARIDWVRVKGQFSTPR